MPTLDHVLQIERDTLKFRLLALLVIAVSLFLRRDVVPAGATVGLIGGYLAYNVALDRVLLPRFQNLPMLGVMLLADVGAVLAALQIIGFNTPVFIFLPLVVVYYSLYLGYTGSLIAATVASLGYALLATTVGSSELRNAVSIQVPFFFLVALLTGYLSSQRIREREEKRALQQLIEAETHTRGMVDLTSTLLQNLNPPAVGTDLARLGALTAGTPLCVLLQAEPEKSRLVGLASNSPLEAHGLPNILSSTESLSSNSPGARILRGEIPFALWNQEQDPPDNLPTWVRPGTIQELAAVGLPRANGTMRGVIYFLNPARAGTLAPKVEQLQQFGALAAGLLERVSLAPQVEERSTRLLGELQQTVKSMGRFRELRGREVLRLDSLTIDPTRERVTVGQALVSLSKAEFDVLYLLAEKVGNPVSKEVLLREVWGEGFIAQGNVVDVCVHRLRRKLADTTVGLDLIKTVRGRGYMLQLPRATTP